MALLSGDRSHSCLSPPSPKRFLHHAISAPVLCSGVSAPNCVRYEAYAMKHISYFLAAMLAVAVLTPRQGCAQDATKLVPTEPAPARSAAPVKPTPLTVKQTYNAICGAARDSERCGISSGVSGADANGNLQGTEQCESFCRSCHRGSDGIYARCSPASSCRADRELQSREPREEVLSAQGRRVRRRLIRR